MEHKTDIKHSIHLSKSNNQINRVHIKNLNRHNTNLDMNLYMFLKLMCKINKNYMMNIMYSNHQNTLNMMKHKINRSLNSSKNQKNNLMYISPIFTYNISQKYTSNIDYLYYMQSNFIHIHNNLIRENNILQHRQRSMFLKQNYINTLRHMKNMMYLNLMYMLDKKRHIIHNFTMYSNKNRQHILTNKSPTQH